MIVDLNPYLIAQGFFYSGVSSNMKIAAEKDFYISSIVDWSLNKQ